LNPGETKTITYKIKPKSSGDFLFSPTTVTVMAGETYYSDTAKTIVRCNQNNLCELDLEENYFNCPEDCPSGSEDNVCDLISDNVCDPDCIGDADVDCIEKKKFPWMLVIVATIIIVIIIILILIKSKNN